jgi:hypothetical protein
MPIWQILDRSEQAVSTSMATKFTYSLFAHRMGLSFRDESKWCCSTTVLELNPSYKSSLEKANKKRNRSLYRRWTSLFIKSGLSVQPIPQQML